MSAGITAPVMHLAGQACHAVEAMAAPVVRLLHPLGRIRIDLGPEDLID